MDRTQWIGHRKEHALYASRSNVSEPLSCSSCSSWFSFGCAVLWIDSTNQFATSVQAKTNAKYSSSTWRASHRKSDSNTPHCGVPPLSTVVLVCSF